jgi:hypothetical protein
MFISGQDARPAAAVREETEESLTFFGKRE